jgi:hypothetical protein
VPHADNSKLLLSLPPTQPIYPLVSSMLNRCIELVHIDANLRVQQFRQRASITEVDPVCLSRSFLRVLPLTQVHVVEAFGARCGRGEPYLLVGRLLVDHVCAVGWEGEGEDAGL